VVELSVGVKKALKNNCRNLLLEAEPHKLCLPNQRRKLTFQVVALGGNTPGPFVSLYVRPREGVIVSDDAERFGYPVVELPPMAASSPEAAVKFLVGELVRAGRLRPDPCPAGRC
jgi:hypothetical protein